MMRLALFTAVACAVSFSSDAAGEPNLVVIMTDDMGYADVGFNGCEDIPTPHIDSIAANGVKFTSGYVGYSVCGPSRASFMTGRYGQRFGFERNPQYNTTDENMGLPLSEATIASALSQVGYHCGVIGKWHLGATSVHHPLSRGFDEFYGHLGGGHRYFPEELTIQKSGEADSEEESYRTWILRNHEPVEPKKYLTDEFSDEAVSFVARNHEKPFFLFLAYNAPHTPLQATEEYLARFQEIEDEKRRTYAAMVSAVDDGVGRVLEALREHEVEDNTLVFFLSDNGGPSKKNASCNTPLRGGKGDAWEGGFRVPFAAQWPAGFPKGVTYDQPVISLDIFATIAALSGAPVAAERPLDGVDITPFVNGGEGVPHESIYLRKFDSGVRAIRNGDHKLVVTNRGTSFSLHDLSEDISEANNIAGSAPETVSRLEKLWAEWNEPNIDPVFLGLIHTPAWKARTEKARGQKEEASEAGKTGDDSTKKSSEAWKDQFFKMHPEADTDKDGALSWPEYKSHKEKLKNSERSTEADASEAATGTPVHVKDLLAPQATLAMKVQTAGEGGIERAGDRWRIAGKSPLRVEFVPADKEAWDISSWRLVGIPMRNQQPGVTTVDGRINNGNLTSWSHHAVGFGVAPAGEDATLGFAFPVVEDRYKGPDVFGDQLAKPNGHRVHWRRFFPEDIRVMAMDIHSSTGDVDLVIGDPFLAWPADAELDRKLEAMPYLDDMGQVRAVEWPGKSRGIDEARPVLFKELKDAADSAEAGARRLSRFGGWLDGPRLEATGHFRTEKVDGKWWFIDPEGHLFFSVGVCLAGHVAETAINQKRLDAGFFEYLPGEGDYLRWIGRRKYGSREMVNFPAINYARLFGEEWEERNRAGIHDRMRAWGVNTLAAWGDEDLRKDGRTPYTLVASIWWKSDGHRAFPSPFREDYEEDVRQALEKFAWAADDPYCLGIFLGNELEWPDRFTPKVFEVPETDATKSWVLERLKQKYGALADLNGAWKTEFADWDQVLRVKPTPIPEAAWGDIEPFYVEFLSTFFARSWKVIKDVLPDKLYLGCRTHRGPDVLGRAAAGHVDVFSVNVYDSEVRSWQVPDDVDIPILASEFHFGAADRGVPSPGLAAVWDQRQRGLAFCNYLASALAEPRFVGVHWFQWIDQSAAGRSDRENHQCGFVDVTGRAYPEFTRAVSRATRAMYPARVSGGAETPRVKMLAALLEE